MLLLDHCDTLADLRVGALVAAGRKPQRVQGIQRLPSL
jgi:hypothetical protein